MIPCFVENIPSYSNWYIQSRDIDYGMTENMDRFYLTQAVLGALSEFKDYHKRVMKLVPECGNPESSMCKSALTEAHKKGKIFSGSSKEWSHNQTINPLTYGFFLAQEGKNLEEEKKFWNYINKKFKTALLDFLQELNPETRLTYLKNLARNYNPPNTREKLQNCLQEESKILPIPVFKPDTRKCFNARDYITLDEWSEIPEKQSLVIIYDRNNDRDRDRGEDRKGYCYLRKTLLAALESNVKRIQTPEGYQNFHLLPVPQVRVNKESLFTLQNPLFHEFDLETLPAPLEQQYMLVPIELV